MLEIDGDDADTTTEENVGLRKDSSVQIISTSAKEKKRKGSSGGTLTGDSSGNICGITTLLKPSSTIVPSMHSVTPAPSAHKTLPTPASEQLECI